MFSCDTITDTEIRGKLERIRARVKSVARPLICLPNIHPKARLESPPQFVATTRGTIVPQLSAPAMNCGMSIFTTTLTASDFTEDFLRQFAASLRSGVKKRPGKGVLLGSWLGFSRNKQTPYDLSKKELEDMFIHGAEAACKKYQLPKEELGHIEYNGCTLTQEEKNVINLKELIPRSSYKNARHEMGYNFGGNHFLEFHAVEKIVDKETARAFGIAENQLLLSYHGGGGHATYHLGRYFARREKNTPFEKAALFLLKLPFHFASWNGIRRARARWQAYFSHAPFPEIQLHTKEGKRLMESIKVALNYGYAFRAALLRRIKDALPRGDASFLWDAAHNSIREETIAGEELVIHRQDAAHIFPGKPVFVAGFNTLSYLGVGTEKGETAFYSITPSAGKTIARFMETGHSKEDAGHYTLLSKRKEKDLIRVPHTTPEGLFHIVNAFEKEGMIRPVAYLRPLASIKGH